MRFQSALSEVARGEKSTSRSSKIKGVNRLRTINLSANETNVKCSRDFFLAREQSSKWIKSLATRNPCLVPTTHGWIKRDCFGNLSVLPNLIDVPPFAHVANPTHLPSFLLAFAEKASQLESARNA